MLKMSATFEQPVQQYHLFFHELQIEFPKPEVLGIDPSSTILECKKNFNSVVIVHIPQITLNYFYLNRKF